MDRKNISNIIDETLDKTKIKYDQQLNNVNELNINFWDENNNLYPEIRNKILTYVKILLENSELEKIKIYDIILTGSIAAYNYTEFSDVDVHIIIKKSDIGLNNDFIDDYLRTKTKLWNIGHSNKIYNHDIETYIQDVDEKNYNTGEYSILKNKWNKLPNKSFIVINKQRITKKVNHILDYINKFKDMDYDTFTLYYTNLIKKLRNYRKKGLEKNGVYSDENIVFKVLRDNNVLTDIIQIKKEKLDKKTSLS